jgi:hypothetical protein
MNSEKSKTFALIVSTFDIIKNLFNEARKRATFNNRRNRPNRRNRQKNEFLNPLINQLPNY